MSEDKNNQRQTESSEEVDAMNAIAEKSKYKRLDFSKLNFCDDDITTEESLRDVVPFKWSKEVLQGKKKVIIKKTEDK